MQPAEAGKRQSAGPLGAGRSFSFCLHQGFEDFWPHTVSGTAPDGAGGGNVRLTPKQDRLLPRRKPWGDSEPWLVELSLVVGAA